MTLQRDAAMRGRSPDAGAFVPETVVAERYRTVAHPNVCRVYDIGDLPATNGLPARTFLTMEYIDGEDLASLLRRSTCGRGDAISGMRSLVPGAQFTARPGGVPVNVFDCGSVISTSIPPVASWQS